jgi:hypothetical protein
MVGRQPRRHRHALVRIDPATGATRAVLQTVMSESFKG